MGIGWGTSKAGRAVLAHENATLTTTSPTKEATSMAAQNYPTDQPLDAKSIVAETLAVARECRRILQTHHAQEANMIGQVCALLDGLDLAVIRGLKGTE